MQAYLLVGLGGGVGAMCRYGFGVMVGRLHSGLFPLGTFGVNVIGSLLMGLLIGFLARTTPEWQPEARLLLATGLLGGFTTFSAFSLDVVTLIERGSLITAALYAVASMILAVLALFIGMWLTRSVF
ncbi:MAG: fluoride efflux transporter CrcB [Alphaproteobacteria bacterium]|nr:fluoride efflux transporter CrcB [Alphaproteobacteria bacterium]